MAISSKGKRTIVLHQRSYLWWVFEEYDQSEFDGRQVKIVAADRHIFFKYGLQQTPEQRFLVVGLGGDAGKVHLLCPKFEQVDGSMTPGGIAAMVDWVSDTPSLSAPRKIIHAWSGKAGILSATAAEEVYQQIQTQLQHRSITGN